MVCRDARQSMALVRKAPLLGSKATAPWRIGMRIICDSNIRVEFDPACEPVNNRQLCIRRSFLRHSAQ
jgi:hypothetical protein